MSEPVRARFAATARPRAVYLAAADPGALCSPLAERSRCLRLLLCVAGDADHLVVQAGRRRLCRVPAGTALLAPPGHPIEAGPSACATANLLVDEEVVLLRARDRGRSEAPTLACSPPAIAPLAGLARALAAMADRPARDPLLLDTVDLLRRHAVALLEEAGGDLRRPVRDAFAAACRLIEEDLAAEHSRAAIATAVGVHPNHLSRLFAQRAGMGLARWIAERRLERAGRLIREGLQEVGAAGRAVGFSSPAVFAQTCRRLRGHPPGGFRP